MKHEMFGSKRMAALSVFENFRTSIFREFSIPNINEIDERKILLETVQALDARRKLIDLIKDGNVIIIE